MARIIVTGGAGYIGSHACRRLAELGHEPITIDNLTTGWRDAVRFGPFIEVDLLDRDCLRNAMIETAADAVMHFAALSIVNESVKEPERYWRNNVCGTLNLIDAMTDAGIDKLVFSSTAATYGEAHRDLISETAAQQPSNPYGATKLAVERMIHDYSVAHGLKYITFRYFNVGGAARDGMIGEFHHPETHLIPLILDAASGRRKAITIFGRDYDTPDGTCVRDYLHVCDLVEAHIKGVDYLLEGGDNLIANLGTGRGYSVDEVVNQVRQITALDVPTLDGARRPGDPPHLVCNPARAMDVLGWRPSCSDLPTIIADAWRWHQRSGYSQ